MSPHHLSSPSKSYFDIQNLENDIEFQEKEKENFIQENYREGTNIN